MRLRSEGLKAGSWFRRESAVSTSCSGVPAFAEITSSWGSYKVMPDSLAVETTAEGLVGRPASRFDRKPHTSRVWDPALAPRTNSASSASSRAMYTSAMPFESLYCEQFLKVERKNLTYVQQPLRIER